MATDKTGLPLKYLDTKKVLGIPDDKDANRWLISAVEKVIGIGQYNEMFADLGPDCLMPIP